MACYLISPGSATPATGDRVKIGFAENVASRVFGLQSGHWDRLFVVRTWTAGTRRSEAWLHRRFAHVNIDREWFWFDAEMMTVELPDFTAVPTIKSDPFSPSAVSEIIDVVGGPTFISSALKLPPTTVSNWRGRGSIPARYHRAVLDLSAGRVTEAQIIDAHAMEPN